MDDRTDDGRAQEGVSREILSYSYDNSAVVVTKMLKDAEG
jgi:hypothetical protein